MDDTDNHIQQALALARTGRIEEARNELVALIRADENNVAAWAALAQIADTPKDAAYCLNRILRIQPGNEWVRTQLQLLTQQQQAIDQTNEIDEQSQQQAVAPQSRELPRVPMKLVLGVAGAFALLCLLGSLLILRGGPALGVFSGGTSQPGLPTGRSPLSAPTSDPGLSQPTTEQATALTDEVTSEPGAPAVSTATNATAPTATRAAQTSTATLTSSPTQAQALTPTGYPTPTDPPEPPDVPTAEPPPADAPCSCSLSLTCDDFSTQVDAQACYEYCFIEMELYLFQLDADQNDQACEDLP